MAATHRSQKRYPPELRERAVRMVTETIEQTGERFGAITRIARQLGIGAESLRTWDPTAQASIKPRALQTGCGRARMRCGWCAPAGSWPPIRSWAGGCAAGGHISSATAGM